MKPPCFPTRVGGVKVRYIVLQSCAIARTAQMNSRIQEYHLVKLFSLRSNSSYQVAVKDSSILSLRLEQSGRKQSQQIQTTITECNLVSNPKLFCDQFRQIHQNRQTQIQVQTLQTKNWENELYQFTKTLIQIDFSYGHGNAHTCQLKLKGLHNIRFTPSPTPPRCLGEGRFWL